MRQVIKGSLTAQMRKAVSAVTGQPCTIEFDSLPASVVTPISLEIMARRAVFTRPRLEFETISTDSLHEGIMRMK